MPVIVNSYELHPFLPSLGSAQAIDQTRALHQDIRPLEIAIINLMADKQATERQLAVWLGNTPLQVNLTFAATDEYIRSVQAGRETRHTPAQHIRKFYSAWSEIKDQKFDGLIITGVNADQERVEDEVMWPEVTKILDWAKSHTLSSLYLCWGALAALKHYHNIDSPKASQKTFGLFEHKIISDPSGLLFGLPDIFSVPVSRWRNPDRKQITKCSALDIVADADAAGANILAEVEVLDNGKLYFPRRIYMLNHPEYDTNTLQLEYERDCKLQTAAGLPFNYFPYNDPSQQPVNVWRHTAAIYTNWIKTIYEATPLDIADVPQLHKAA